MERRYIADYEFRCPVCDTIKARGKYMPYYKAKKTPGSTDIKVCTKCVNAFNKSKTKTIRKFCIEQEMKRLGL